MDRDPQGKQNAALEEPPIDDPGSVIRATVTVPAEKRTWIGTLLYWPVYTGVFHFAKPYMRDQDIDHQHKACTGGETQGSRQIALQFPSLIDQLQKGKCDHNAGSDAHQAAKGSLPRFANHRNQPAQTGPQPGQQAE